jgi:hypothetical protein
MDEWIERRFKQLGDVQRQEHTQDQNEARRERVIKDKAPDFVNRLTNSAERQIQNFNEKFGASMTLRDFIREPRGGFTVYKSPYPTALATCELNADEGIIQVDIQRTYEAIGTKSDRLVFHLASDTSENLVALREGREFREPELLAGLILEYIVFEDTAV